MTNNNLEKSGDRVLPTKQERAMGALTYLLFLLGDNLSFGIFIGLGLISEVTDLPYFVRFHWSQAMRNSIIAIPAAILILLPLVY
jgi:hypothetical protein